MTLKLRLENLERSAAAVQVEGIRRPEDVPEEIWRRAMELLADYSPEMLRPWKSLEDVAEWCVRLEPKTWDAFPDPVLDVVGRASSEAETGVLPLEWSARLRNQLAALPEMPEDELMDILRLDEAAGTDYGLPLPYTKRLLEETGHGDLTTPCMYYFCELRRGAITAAEHAAQLAKILPPVTRADMEKTARAFLKKMLKGR
jgi:hypothetical protein